jgi:homoserine kinase type II
LAVYTELDAETLSSLIAAYDVGTLVSAKGIAEGISNSNWVIETEAPGAGTRRYILTMYERRIDTADLPFFLGLLDHLAARGCAVPATIHDSAGARWREHEGKAVALIEFLPGVSPSQPSAPQAHSVGEALARVHLAARDFPLARPDPLDPQANQATLEGCGPERLAAIAAELAESIPLGRALAARWPADLPASIIHSDLFPDNVLMLGDRVTGLIDFYFACNGLMAYDLAVTHAAWCFDRTGAHFDAELGQALLRGYQSLRPLEAAERSALPLLAQGACLRFVASRAEDWLEAPAGVRVMRKDPMEFFRRWQFYREAGLGAFAFE